MDADSILENLECAVILINDELTIQFVNIASEILLGQSRVNLIGKCFVEFIPNSKVTSYIETCLKNKSMYTLREIPLNLIGKETLVDITLSCVSNRRGIEPSVLVEINSINRISRFMKEKNQTERQKSFRLMMRGLAHEIKNPLAGIRGAAQLLTRENVDSEQQELTEILIKEADRLTHLVDRVMGSREQLKPARLNIHEVIEHVVQLVNVKSDNELIINRFYDPTLPEIVVDREQIIQAVLNIVVNAIEAQKDSEQVSIGFITQFQRLVTINRKMHRQVMKILIWDNGPGIPDDIKDVIFDPLITGRPDGTGLGLSITQEIVHRHNGTLALEELGEKTCFSIYLPFTENAFKENTTSLEKHE